MKKLSLLLQLLLVSLFIGAQPLQRVSPASVGLDASRLANADAAILKAIQHKDIPGAVLAVVRHGKMAWLKAYGNKEIYPKQLPMTTNTVFDMASCSKSMSTAISAMILIERGQLRLLDRVNHYIPGFQDWKDAKGETIPIRIVDIMTHSSGLPPYAPVDSLKRKYGSPNRDGVIDYISHCKRDFKPETDFQYSCLNYITLQRIIETISGQNLRDFAKKNIFDVLGMTHTDYNPNSKLCELCAPTEKQPDGSVLQGVVHDPLARIMNGGISGNAGVFSSADDIAVLVAALQNGGEWNGHRILSPLGVKAMRTVPRCVASLGRTLGWDIFSPYASNNGDLLGPNTYGHTGYTGTSIVIDPDNDVAVILLTNRVHPNDAGDCIQLRSLVANAVAASIIPDMGKSKARK
ncbi:MAG: serine hydrolase [Bacteroidales bacterium]|nr:serine hydrolase [Bacteroidales bacterium]